MNKNISIVIPVYNGQRTIKECLASIFRAECSNYEVIVVDDCSTDNSLKIAQSFPCKIIKLDERRGPGFARDKGAAVAEGEIVAFLDADCIIPQDWLTKINKKLNPQIIGLGGRYLLPEKMSKFSQILLSYQDIKNIFYAKPQENISFSGGNCAFWRAALLQRTEKKELSLCNKMVGGEDTTMCYELSRLGKLIYDPDLTVLHNKADSPWGILKSAVRYGYTGAVVAGQYGNLLIRERHRVYKGIVYLFSITLLLLPPIFLFTFKNFAYSRFFIGYLIIQLPIAIFLNQRLSLGWGLILMPAGVFLTDTAHFIGHLKRIHENFLHMVLPSKMLKNRGIF